MTGRKLRWLDLGLLAGGSAGLLALTSVMNSAFAFGDDTALVLGPSLIPVPPPLYVDAVDDLYIQRLDPGAAPVPLTTPEGLYPLSGVNSLPLDTSIAQGEATLNNAILHQVNDLHNHVDVFGYSQSSIISSLLMPQLTAEGVPSSDVSFILVGNENNPDGGMFERFVGASFPSFGITLNDATPSNLYPTDIYTNEYDGFADFPRYPLNFVSDLNAYLGLVFQHLAYADLTPQQISNAIDLGTFGDTTYQIIPATSLPLLDPLLLFGSGGKVLYDLLEPDTALLVNLGYGNVDSSFMGGFDHGNPSVPTPFGLFPTDINPSEVMTALSNGWQQGVTDALKDLQSPPSTAIAAPIQQILDVAHTFGLTPSDNPTLMQLLGAVATIFNGDVPTTPITATSSPEEIVNILTSVVTKDIEAVLPLQNLGTALGVSLPNYDASLFMDQLEAGNLLGAIGDPIAANLGLFLLPTGAGLAPILEATATTIYDLFGGFAP
jgi:PE-PPE domain